MAIVNTLKIYEALRSKLQDEPAKAIADVIEKSLEEYQEHQNEFLATKSDVKDMATKTDLANLRAELIKWMFIFWVGQIGVLTGILLAFFKS